MNYANIQTGEIREELPTSVMLPAGWTNHPTWEQLRGIGWRQVVFTAAAPAGMVVTEYKAQAGDEDTCHLAIAASVDATPTPAGELLPSLQLFRTLLRKHFGANAERDPKVSSDTVAEHFVAMENPNAKDVRDMVALSFLYSKLAPRFSGDLNTVPWSKVP